jgi:hypothetical protein
MSLFSSLFIIHGFLAGQWGQPVHRAMLVYPGVAVGIPPEAWCSPIGLPDVSQAGLELVSGGMGILLFSQCNMAWRGSGC